MTNEEFIALAKTCKDKKELLNKLAPGVENTRQNRHKYIRPLREAAGLAGEQLTALFIK